MPQSQVDADAAIGFGFGLGSEAKAVMRPRERIEVSPARSAFLAVLEPVLVCAPVFHAFPGAIERDVARAVWTWLERDIAPDLAARFSDCLSNGRGAGRVPRPSATVAFDTIAEPLLDRVRAMLAAEEHEADAIRRNTIQLGGPESRRRLPYVIMAIRRRALLAQAAEFGRALSHLQDEAALRSALATITIRNPVTRALWMQAMVATLANPARVMRAAVAMAGGGSEDALVDAGFGPLVDAILSHAQNQLSALMTQPGIFGDYDLACRAVDRFHRLMGALRTHCDFGRRARRATIVTDLTARFSERLDRPLRQVSGDVTQALRRPREDGDGVEPDRVLSALNGLYLLATVRRSRDSLAVNTVLDQVWGETGQALEVLAMRALEVYRGDPADPVARERLDAGIKMAGIRYNEDYADILRRARDGALRRTQVVAVASEARVTWPVQQYA